MSTVAIVFLVLGVLVLLILVAGLSTQLPEIRRYLKAKSM
jgi:hypothetical protein